MFKIQDKKDPNNVVDSKHPIDVFIVNFENISCLFLVFLLLTLGK